MYISKFSRISTTVNPGFYSSVVYIADGDGPGEDPDSVAETILKDRDSLDAVVFDSEDGDVLGIPGVHRIMRQVKPKGLAGVVVTDGEHPDALDDILGAGYADAVFFRFAGKLTDTQERCIGSVRDNDYPFSVSVSLVPGRIDETVLRDMARSAKDCRQFVMRSSDPRYGTEVFKKKELDALAGSVRGMTRRPLLL